MSTPFQTSYLAMVARLPDHFYSLVYALEGRDVLYQNPGVSLRSFVVKELRNELVVLPEELLETVRECEQFSSSLPIIKTVVELLINEATRVISELNQLPKLQDGSPNALTSQQLMNYAAKLHSHGQMIKTQFESIALQSADTKHVDTINHDSLVGQHFKQSLIDMQYLLDEVKFAMVQAVTAPDKKA